MTTVRFSSWRATSAPGEADSGVRGGTYAVRRTRGGDAWAALQDAPVPGKPAVSLGMPGVGAPAPVGLPACSG